MISLTKFRWSLTGYFVGTVVAAMMFAGVATAATPEDLLACSDAVDTLAQPDGFTLVTGVTGDCDGSNPSNPTNLSNESVVLLRLGPDGSPDRTFSDGGVRIFEPSISSDPVNTMKSGGGFVLAMSSRLLKVTADGKADQSFGENGVTPDIGSVVPGATDMSAAIVQDDGKILVVTTSGDLPAVLRYSTDGSLDDTFDHDGIAHPAVPVDLAGFRLASSAIGVDGEDRITVVGGDVQGAIAIRLLPDGNVDTAFGPAGTGFSRGPAVAGEDRYLETKAVFVEDDGAFRAYGAVESGTVSPWAIWENALFRFSEDGAAADPLTTKLGPSNTGKIEETPGGGLAASSFPFRYPAAKFPARPSFVFTKFAPPTGFVKRASLPQVESDISAISYVPFDNTLVAAGWVKEPRGGSHMVVSKSDSDTGESDPVFGADGTVVIPENECEFGEVPQEAGQAAIAWNRCRINPPSFKRTSIQFRKARSARPSLSGTIRLDRPDLRIPALVRQRITIRLPQRLRLSRTSVSRIKADVLTDYDASTSSVNVRGRTITVNFEPEPDSDPYGLSTVELAIHFEAGPGALRRMPPRMLHRRFNVRVTTTFSPHEFRNPSPVPSRFLGENTSTKIVKVRPARPRR